jgi:diacylglycerol kinase family enzyme
VRPTSAAETTRLAAAAAAEGLDAVIAAGGDGTAAAVARGLAGTATALGILPLGTANDLARVLGLRRAPARAAARLADARTRSMDLVAMNGTTFCTVGGLGIVSDSALAAARLKSGTGRLARVARALGGGIYRATALGELATRRPLRTRVEIEVTSPDGSVGRLAVDSPGLFVANQRMCGGGLSLPRVGPDDDGVFELLVIQRVSRARLVDAFTRLTLKLPIPDAVLRVIPGVAARIHCEREETFLGDGDALGTGCSFALRALPRTLRVLA